MIIHNPKVILVEDKQDTRDQVCCELMKLGYGVTTASDESEAFKSTMSTNYDVALINTLMPNGLNILRGITANQHRTLGIALVGEGEGIDLSYAVRAGAVDTVVKPFSLEQLRSSVEGAIQRCHPEGYNDISVPSEIWQTVFNVSPDMTLIIAPDLRILCCNQAVSERSGKPQEALIGRDCHDALCPREHDRNDCGFIVGRTNWDRPKNFYHHAWQRFFSLKIVPLRDHAGATWAWLNILRDMTYHRKLLARLYRSHRNESIGHLVGGIAHEISTPTQYMTGNIEFLSDSFKKIQSLLKHQNTLMKQAHTGRGTEDKLMEITRARDKINLDYLWHEIPRALRDTQEGADRIANTTNAMRMFSETDDNRIVAVDINKLIQSAIVVTRSEWKYIEDIKTHFDKTLPCVECLCGAFKQAILNLLLNAAEAIATSLDSNRNKKGLITVQTECHNHLLDVQIGDNGCGIPDDIKSRIFDPFFTTKKGAHERGYGLVFVQETIVRKHGGRIIFNSTLGSGTTFIVQIPLAIDDSCMETLRE